MRSAKNSYQATDEYDDNSANDREDKTRRMKRRSFRWFGEQPGDQASDNRANNTQYGREEKVACAKMHYVLRDEARNEADDDVPNDV